jgi:hypothetical protein
MNPIPPSQLAPYHQRDLLREAEHERLALQATAEQQDGGMLLCTLHALLSAVRGQRNSVGRQERSARQLAVSKTR